MIPSRRSFLIGAAALIAAADSMIVSYQVR